MTQGQSDPAFRTTMRAGQVYQTTLRHQISCTGVGLHSGQKIHMCLRPAPASSGIIFKRIDVPRGEQKIKARFDAVSDTLLGTTISNESGVEVSTIEHLMAALTGCGVDNVLIELDGPEVPVMDGSSAPFVFLIECAGVQELKAARKSIRILDEIRVQDGEKIVSLTPSDHYSLEMEIDFENAAVEQQHYFFDFSSAGFKIELSRARTFGFMKEVESLRQVGRALGGSLENSIVIDGDRILNRGGLRYRDEFVRHKVLDAIGDLSLAGAPIIGHFSGQKSGHAMNNRLLRALFDTPQAWAYDSDEEDLRVAAAPQRALEDQEVLTA